MKVDYLIFTDASLIQNGKYSSYGVVILNPKNGKYTTFGGYLGETTIMYGEAKAILQGLRYVKELKRKKKLGDLKVAVVSDSQTNINILNDFIYGWDKSNPKKWKTSRKKPVANVKIYKEIWDKFITDDSYVVRFAHINSHKSHKNKGYIKRHMKRSGVDISDDTASIFIDMNNLADKIATTTNKKAVHTTTSEYVLIRKDKNNGK